MKLRVFSTPEQRGHQRSCPCRKPWEALSLVTGRTALTSSCGVRGRCQTLRSAGASGHARKEYFRPKHKVRNLIKEWENTLSPQSAFLAPFEAPRLLSVWAPPTVEPPPPNRVCARQSSQAGWGRFLPGGSQEGEGFLGRRQFSRGRRP